MTFDTDKYLNTRDLYFASYLFAKGYKLTFIKPDETGVFCWFIFEEKNKCEQEEQLFLKNEAIVKAKDYSEAIKYLKRKVSQ
jgi:hypothetical protein